VAWLLALNGDLLGKWFPLEAPCLVGRASLNHVVIDDPRISRQHAKIAAEEGGYVVYDLNSANGTFVDDQPIKRKRLEHGATVRFGPYAFSFKESRERAAASSSPVGPFGGNLEVRTLHGMQPPVQILESLAVSGEQDGVTSLTVLEESYRKLSTLHGFMRSLSTTLETDALVDRIIDNLLETFAASEVGVYLYDERNDALRPLRARRHTGDELLPRPLSPPIFEEVVRRGRAVLSATPIPPGADTPPPAGITLHAPMMNGNRLLGVLAVRDTQRGDRFRQRDLDLLAGLAAVAALSLHNAQMQAERVRRGRISQDLMLAREIQKSFLPRTLPTGKNVELAAEYRPVYTIGGDVYDAQWLDDRRLGVFIGDVAGKGVAAALLMARVTSDLRVATRATGSPAQILSSVNAAMLEREQHEVFVTGVFLSLDARTGKVVLANAGHCPPLLRRAGGSIERVEESAPAMGFFRETSFSECELSLEPGDTLALYTDGIVEAKNAAGEEFGDGRLAEALAAPAEDARRSVDQVLGALSAHTGNADPNDDLTIIVCRFR
jgi:serine phosphatase RsbU (regulator of sigma subunit)/pSer/pThr/pTyr-binding forkhead associated (FHA) protein